MSRLSEKRDVQEVLFQSTLQQLMTDQLRVKNGNL